MTTNRRNFLRNTLLGTGMLATGFAGHAASLGSEPTEKHKGNRSNQRFNMSGYAAPKIDKVR
ncbi:MAG TPA: acetylgalactosaminidase, partial [Prolixibacteraceae bacterium]|nr:acetylgalactosaminidase [Prolixibacteraceae bacterium]